MHVRTVSRMTTMASRVRNRCSSAMSNFPRLSWALPPYGYLPPYLLLKPHAQPTEARERPSELHEFEPVEAPPRGLAWPTIPDFLSTNQGSPPESCLGVERQQATYMPTSLPSIRHAPLTAVTPFPPRSPTICSHRQSHYCRPDSYY